VLLARPRAVVTNEALVATYFAGYNSVVWLLIAVHYRVLSGLCGRDQIDCVLGRLCH
jgi:hypothetical protein